MKEDLQELIEKIRDNVKSGEIDKRVIYFCDYKSKYVVLKPLVKVRVEITDGKVFEIDVTDYFEGSNK